MAKSQELPGASPPGPLPGLCPGPAGGLTAPPRPPAVLGNYLWSLRACLRHAIYLVQFHNFLKELPLPTQVTPPFLRMLDPALNSMEI